MSQPPSPEMPEDREDLNPPAPTRSIPAEALFAGDHCVWIDHNGVRYLLRVTRRGRLILTK